MTTKAALFYVALLLLLPGGTIRAATWQDRLLSLSGNAAIIVEDIHGHRLLSHQSDQPFIPASTIKLATAICALKVMPNNFHYPTGVYLDRSKNLYLKGYGDPSLTSDELAQLAKEILLHRISSVNDIILDSTFFSSNLHIDGRSKTKNPYDAANGALLANYNTIKVRKLKNGRLESAEPQTPLTEITPLLVGKLGPGVQRINLSAYPKLAVLYVGYLLKEFLKQNGIAVRGDIRSGNIPADMTPIFTHLSAKNLRDNIREMLKYSNNFIANQLFLTTGAYVYGTPATVEKGRNVLTNCLRRNFGWKKFHIEEGSGLSRRTKVTANEMLRLLRAFERDSQLLPLERKLYRAKTGTLHGVSNMVGYLSIPDNGSYRFVILVNDPKATYHTKFRLAQVIYDGLRNKHSQN